MKLVTQRVLRDLANNGVKNYNNNVLPVSCHWPLYIKMLWDECRRSFFRSIFNPSTHHAAKAMSLCTHAFINERATSFAASASTWSSKVYVVTCLFKWETWSHLYLTSRYCNPHSKLVYKLLRNLKYRTVCGLVITLWKLTFKLMLRVQNDLLRIQKFYENNTTEKKSHGILDTHTHRHLHTSNDQLRLTR